jgi:prepilin-type N-terminal cleavage/methylation domain-containing protein
MSFLINSKNKISAKLSFNSSLAGKSRHGESGFSLVEIIIALLVFLIVLLGVFVTFAYAINYNAGNNARSQGLTVLQQQTELIRSAKYTPTFTDPILTGGTKTPTSASSEDGNKFKVQVVVDDDPFTTGVQTNSATTMKEVSVTVTLESPTPGWQTAVPTTVVLRRVRAN